MSTTQLEVALEQLIATDKQNTLTRELPTPRVPIATTYCRYSGIELQRTPILFDNESSIHFAKHWLFGQSYNSLRKYHYDQRNKSHEQRTLLALAMLLNPATLATKINLKIPTMFDPILLQRNYSQIVWVTNTLADQPKASRTKFLAECPGFSSNAFIDTNPSKLECIAQGTQLIQYICQTVTSAIYSQLHITPALDDALIDSQLLKLELEAHSKRKLVIKHSPSSTEYWNYIIQDIEQTFGIRNSDLIAKFRQQLKQPSDVRTLTQLQSLVKGLADFADVDETPTISSLQFRLALGELKQAISQLTELHNGLDLSLEPKPVPVPADPGMPTKQVVAVNNTTTRVSSPNAIQQRLAALKAKRQSNIDKTKQTTVDFIVKFDK